MTLSTRVDLALSGVRVDAPVCACPGATPVSAAINPSVKPRIT